MKTKLRILYASTVLLFSALFLIHEFGASGQLRSRLLRVHVLPSLKRVTASFSDLKMKLRGPVPPKSKIVIVEIDSPSIEQIGRWPWRRDYTAWLVDRVFAAGAKVVGLDIVFPESEMTVPEELVDALKQRKLSDLLIPFQSDEKLAQTFAHYRSRLINAWQTESPCNPLYSTFRECPVKESMIPPDFERFAIKDVSYSLPFQNAQSPVTTAIQITPNLPLFNKASDAQGFVNADRDSDGIIRKNTLVMMAGGKLFPSLALEMARVALNEEIAIHFDSIHRLDSVYFKKSQRSIPITPLGLVETNFRGPDRSFTYLSARDVLNESDTIKDEVNRKLAGLSKSEVLKDAIVLIGISSLAVGDIIATPYADSMPGVEIHATVLDNLLSDDFLVSQSSGSSKISIVVLLLIVMSVGGGLIGFLAEKLEALPAVGLFIASFLLLGFLDTKVLFALNQNWTTAFLYLELGAVMFTVLIAKYILEEKEKRFIKVAMSKYVSGSVVDLILKDGRALQLGGAKKDLSILFSDIRGFTTFSEKLDAGKLAEFLNDYLGIMTQVVFDCGGTIDKFIGDAIMAFFGAPVDQADHATQACRAAILMQQKVNENKQRYRDKYGIEVEIGVGVNSGVVNVGNMGTESKFDYTVIGDHVNLASRVESATKQYAVQILTTHFTLGEIQERNDLPPIYRVVDIVKLKGKKEAVQLLELSTQGWSDEGLIAFDDAREDYRHQDWDKAIDSFKKAGHLLALKPGSPSGEVKNKDAFDPLCEVYIVRCERFKKYPPEGDWDGSWHLDSK